MYDCSTATKNRRRHRGQNLTREQATVANSILRRVDSVQVQTVGGLAGTGKSHLLTAVADALADFAVCAYTGRAASVLRQLGVDRAKTIHSAIYYPSIGVDGPDGFGRRPLNKIRCGGFLIDEASMVGSQLQRDLASFDLPVVYFGDHGQLPPIGDAEANLMADPDYCLEKIHRNAGEIARFAQHLRQGKAPRTFKGKSKVQLLTQREVTDELLLKANQILVAFNGTRVYLNDRIRCQLGFTDPVAIGDRLICLRNHHQRGLLNGLQANVTAVDTCQSTLCLEADGTTWSDVPYDPDQFGQEKLVSEWSPDGAVPFDYASVITCHKAQSAEWPEVLVLEQIWNNWDHARWAYTAASRASKKLWWIAA